MSLARHTTLAACAGVVLAGSRFVLASVLARRLPQDNFGHFVYAQWLVDITILVCCLGCTGAASRYIAEYRHDERKLIAFLNRWRPFAFGLPLFAGALVVGGAALSGVPFTPAAGLMLAVWAVAACMWSMQTAALIGFQRFDLVLQSNLIAAAVMVGGATSLDIIIVAPSALFGLMAFAAAAATCRGIFLTNGMNSPSSSSLPKEQWKAIRNYAINTWLIALIGALLWTRGELPVVRLYLGDAGVAGYAAALTLFAGAIQGVSLGISAIVPQLTRLWGSGQHTEALAVGRKVTDFQLIACGLAASILICFGQELLENVFGPRYSTQSNSLAILSLGLLSICLSSQNHLLQIFTNGRFSRNLSIFGLALLMAQAFGLIPELGVIGAIFARTSTMIVLSSVSLFAAYKEWGSTSVGLGNFMRVYLVIICCVTLTLAIQPSTIGIRVTIMLATFSILIMAVRDTEKKTVLIAGACRLTRRLAV